MATQLLESRSSTAALWLRIVSWLFKLAGGLFGVAALLSLAGVAMHLPQNDGYSYWVSFMLVSAFAIALFGIGMLLARGSRVGAVLALIITLYPLAFAVSGERPLLWSDVIAMVVTVAVIASIWRQLSWHSTTT